MTQQQYTPGPWDYVASTEHHGPYVTSQFGSDIADCYTMSNLREPSIRNGGTSKPIHFMAEMADANARLIAAAPELLEALKAVVAQINDYERVNKLSPSPGRTECWDCVAHAKQIIAKAELQEPTPSGLAASEGLNKDAALATQEAVMK